MNYLDHAATTPVLPEVLRYYMKTSKVYFANPSSSHHAGEKSKKLLNEARRVLASLLKVNTDNIYFTSGATEAANLLIKGYAKTIKQEKKQIVISSIEHPAVYNTAQSLSKEGWEIKYAIVNEHGIVRLPELLDSINENTSIVCVMSVNNEIGVIQDINAIAEAAKRKNKKIFFISDIVQAFGKIPLSIDFENIDGVFASGHKIGAPKGCGFFYLNPFVNIAPLFSGGGQENGLRSGTTDPIGASCLAKAAEIAFNELNNQYKKIHEINNYLTEQMNIFNIYYHIIVPKSLASPYILTLAIKDVSAHTLVQALSLRECYISAGSACGSHSQKKSHVIEAIGLPCEQAAGVIRISFSQRTNKEEIKDFVNKLRLFLLTL